MTKTMILGGNGCGLPKVLSRDFPGGATKCNEIIQFAVRIKNRSRMKMWRVTTTPSPFLLSLFYCISDLEKT